MPEERTLNGFMVVPHFEGTKIRWEIVIIKQRFYVLQSDKSSGKHYEPVGLPSEPETIGWHDDLASCARFITQYEVKDAKRQGIYSKEGRIALIQQVDAIIKSAEQTAEGIIRSN